MLTYNLVRSKRKTLAIHIKPDGTLEVRAPLTLPQQRIDAFVKEKQGWIEQASARVMQRNANRIAYTPEEIAAYKKEARNTLKSRLDEISEMTGLAYSGFRLSSARTNWGSCSGKNSINLSWRLMLLQPGLRDYVILHELCHTKEHNHSQRFWALVGSFMPDYKERRKILKKAAEGIF